MSLLSPVHFHEWQAALAQVRALYWDNQHKLCAARCETLLERAAVVEIHPLQRTFLNFCAAISLEATASSLHPLSTNKHPLLHSAKEHFLRAAASFPAPPTVSHDTSPRRLSVCSSVFSMPFLGEHPSHSYSSMSSISSIVSKPSPLRIHKAVHFASDELDDDADVDSSSNSSSTTASTPTPTSTTTPIPTPTTATTASPPPPLTPSSPLGTCCTSPSSTSPSTSTSITADLTNYLDTRAQLRFKALLSETAPLLNSQPARIDAVMARTALIQRTRRVPFSELRNHEDDDVRAADRRRRIERLRREGWRRERFRPERYVELERRVLAELAG